MFGFSFGKMGVPGVLSGIASAINSMFASNGNNSGAWYRPSKATTLPWYQDSMGITPVTAMEQPVGFALDSSGSGNNALQATAASRPILSSRVNLLTKTDVIGDLFVWAVGPNMVIGAIEGTLNGFPARRVTSSLAGNSYISETIPVQVGMSYCLRVLSDTGTLFNSYVQAPQTGRNVPAVITALGSGVWEYKYTVTMAATEVNLWCLMPGVDQAAGTSWRVASPQLEVGPAATRYQRVNTATDYDAVGFPSYLTFDGAASGLNSATGGGGTAGFFFCAAVRVTGGTGTQRAIFSDDNRGASAGYVLVVSSANIFTLYGGNGTAYTALNSSLAVIGTKYLVTAWDDGLNLNLQVGSGALTQVARPVVVAGTAGFALGKGSSQAAEYFLGNIYEAVYVRNSGLTPDQRLQIQRQVAAAAGLTL